MKYYFIHLILLLGSASVFAFNNKGGDTTHYDKLFNSYLSCRESDPVKSIDYLQQALNEAQKIHRDDKVSVTLYHKGYVYRRLGINNLAIADYLKALEGIRESGDKSMEAWVLIDIGNLYRDQKNENALGEKHLQKAIELFDELGDKKGVMIATYCLGELYQNSLEFDKALNQFNKAFQLSKKTKDQSQEIIILSYLGNTYLRKKDLIKAKELFTELLLLSEMLKDENGQANAYLGMGDISGYQGDNNSKSALYLKAIHHLKKHNDKLKISQTLEKLGDFSYESGHYESAVLNLEEAYAIADSNKMHSQQIPLLKKLSNYYLKIGAVEKSRAALQKYAQLQEMEISKNALIAEKEYELDLVKKDNQLQEEKITQKNSALYFSIAIISLLIVFFVIFMFKNKKLNESYKRLFENSIENNKLTKELIEIKEQSKYTSSALKDKQQEQLITTFNHLMNVEKIFLQKDISLEKLAKQMNSNRTYLSQVINDHFNTSFSNLINEYRIREAQNILLDPASKKYTIESIALNIGFNSKSTFNQAFKKITGITPSIFISLNNKNNENTLVD